MAAYRVIPDAEFIETYKVELSRNEDGNPTGKIRSLAPVSEQGFIEEMLIRKERLLQILLDREGLCVKRLWIIAYGYYNDDGTRSDGYSVLFATFDAEEAERIVREDLDSVPKEDRMDVLVYKDGYDLILPAEDQRTADEVIRDIYMTSAWPYDRSANSLTAMED